MINHLLTQMTVHMNPKTSRVFFVLLVLVLFILSAGAPDAVGGMGG